MQVKEYALYKGKELLAMGTKREIAEQLGVSAMNPDFLKQWNKSDELICWIKKARNQDIFARAWVDGYEVKKEPRYRVKLKGFYEINRYLNKCDEKEFLFADSSEQEGYQTRFTRKELEENGLGWVFDCEGIEIEEVE